MCGAVGGDAVCHSRGASGVCGVGWALACADGRKSGAGVLCGAGRADDCLCVSAAGEHVSRGESGFENANERALILSTLLYKLICL